MKNHFISKLKTTKTFWMINKICQKWQVKMSQFGKIMLRNKIKSTTQQRWQPSVLDATKSLWVPQAGRDLMKVHWKQQRLLVVHDEGNKWCNDSCASLVRCHHHWVQMSRWNRQDEEPFLRTIQKGWQRRIVLVLGNANQAVTWDNNSESITLQRRLLRALWLS